MMKRFSSHIRNRERALGKLILAAWPLLFLCGQFWIENCQGFAVLSTFPARHSRQVNTKNDRSIHLEMDPYESQYQQYSNAVAKTTSGYNHMDSSTHTESHSWQQSPVEAEASESPVATQSYHDVPIIRQQTFSNAGKSTVPAAALDPYEQQYQQCAQLTASTPARILDTSVVDPYEQQYQQYAQSMTSVPVKTLDTSVVDPYEQQYQQYAQSTTSTPARTLDTYVPPVEIGTRDTELNGRFQMNDMNDSSPRTLPEVTATGTPPMNVERDVNAIGNGNSVQQNPMKRPYPEQTDDSSNAQEMSLNSQELEEQYLKMVSTEVEVKKLLGQNPYALTDIQLDVVIQRWLDSLEDSTQKNNGKIKGQSKLKRKDMPKSERKTVVVLGTGWAAHAFIKLASTYDLRIVVVSPVNHFVFTPMLASAAVGTIEYRSMTEPIRVTNPFIDNYVEGRAVGIDPSNKLLNVQLTSLSTVTGAFRGIATNAPCRLEPEPPISYSDGETFGNPDNNSIGAGRLIELNYDYLVCAVGTASRSTIVPGAKEFCFNLKTSQDSKRLRTAIGEALEYASRPDVQTMYYPDATEQELATQERQRRVRIVLVGGGPTGVELAGELSDFFAQVCRRPDGAFQHLKDDISVILVHGGSELLPAMDPDLRQRALEALQSQGVELRLNTRLKEVGRDFVRLGEKGNDLEKTIPVGLTVWAAGNAPVPFVKELLSQLPESATGSAGRVNVDRWLRCPTPTPETFGSILVLGDVACLEAESKYDPTPTSLPQTAQVAGQQGAFTARMLNRGYDLNKTPPRLPEASESDEYSLLRIWLLARGLEEAPEFTFLSLGLLAYVGGEEALNQVEIGDVPIFNYSGKFAFALWRSVYLTKQASTRNQALISFDWLRTEAFGRDITRL